MDIQDLPEELRPWWNHAFSSGCYTGDDYKAFENAYAKWLRKALPGYSVDVHRNHYEFSAVVTRKCSEDRPIRHVYLSISDVRFFPKAWYSRVLARTMEHAEDWTGGTNTYCAIGYIPKRVDELMAQMDGEVAA